MQKHFDRKEHKIHLHSWTGVGKLHNQITLRLICLLKEELMANLDKFDGGSRDHHSTLNSDPVLFGKILECFSIAYSALKSNEAL